jgi:hypothetical protein
MDARQRQDLRLDTRRLYKDFEGRVNVHRKNLVELIKALTGDGKKIIGYGAPTKATSFFNFAA